MPSNNVTSDENRLPVIPIKGKVAFPFIPFNHDLVFSYSRNAFRSVEETDRTVFLAFTERNDMLPAQLDELYEVGIIAKAENSFVTEDAIKVTFRGICRGKAEFSYDSEADIFYADIFSYEEFRMPTGGASAREQALRRHMITTLESILRILPTESNGVGSLSDDFQDIGQLSDYVAFTYFQTTKDKLAVLSEYDPFKRAFKVCSVLDNELQIYTEEVYIHQRIHQSMEETQYDNYLREKLKIIREELGDDVDELDEYTAKIKAAVFSADAEVCEMIREKLLKEVNRLSKMQFGSAEASVIKGYLDTCLDLPWGVVTEDRIDTREAEAMLNADHDGLEKPKERIVEYLAVKKLNPKVRNQILCFVGPPGVGKTSLGMSIANAMGRKFARVSLGGIHDEAEIRGHRKTYLGSMPGRIITAVQSAGSCNPVLLLDEIDKMSSNIHGDPSSAMLEVLDAEQNKNFRDHYLEIPFDLSDCLFIATANNIADIPTPLMDRMEIIELSSYTDNEKLLIAKNHLIPKQLARHGLTKSKLKIKDDAVLDIIDGYTRESGVRNLEREIASLCRKAAKGISLGEYKSLTVSKNNLEKLLGPKHAYNEKAGDDDLCGVVNGLAYTSVGGDILKIETCIMPGDGKLQLTGSLGDVMKESAHLAVSYIRANADELSIENDFYKKYDIHIHVPEGATPKDGPSAGVTMLTSLTSALSHRAVRHDIAMTGELTLTGRVLPIGGLREKTFAAYKAGIKTVIIPKDNVPDLDEIDKTVREGLEFKPVSRASEVLGYSLCN